MTEQVAVATGRNKAGTSRILGVTPAWSLAALLTLVAVLVYSRTWFELWPLWAHKNNTYTHGFLVATVALWLAWRARSGLASTPVQPERRALPLVLLLSAAWMLGAAANLLVVHAVLWPVLAFAVVWAGAGWQVARRFAFPLGFLYFAIPFWDFFEPVLQSIASHVVGFLVRIAGVRATIDGDHIMLPDVTLHIALQCSGAHFLAISLAMGTLAGELRGDRLRMRMLILAMAGLLSIAFNSIRILLLVLAYLHPKLDRGFESFDHLTFGWWVFAVDVLVLVLALRLVPTSDPSAAAEPAPADANTQPAVAGAGLPLAIAITLALPAASWIAQRFDSYPPVPPAAASLAGVTGPLSPDTRWQPGFNRPAWEQRVAYLLPDGHVVEIYRNEYHRQRQDQELISGGNQLFGEPTFSQQESAPMQLEVPASAPIMANRLRLLDQSGRSWSAIYTYVVDGESVASARRALQLTTLRTLYRRPVAGIFAAATPCIPDCAAVEKGLETVAALAYGNYSASKGLP